MVFGLGNLLLQVVYHCSSHDKENLEELQKQMQERVNYLNQHSLDSYSDPKLLEYYDLHAQIQKCLFEDHTGQYILIAVVLVGISLLVLIRLWSLKKFGSKNLGKK